jgi:hypothetical protein
MDVEGSSYTDEDVTKAFRDGERCYLCGGTSWLAGPEAGLSRNIECEGCGVDLNVSPLSVERIGWNLSGRFNDDGTLKQKIHAI